jgi:hypothetical protein
MMTMPRWRAYDAWRNDGLSALSTAEQAGRLIVAGTGRNKKERNSGILIGYSLSGRLLNEHGAKSVGVGCSG